MPIKPSSELLGESFQRALTHWRREPREKPDLPPAQPPIPPVTIAVSRQPGARGSEIARQVGAQLGWPVYDRQLLEKIVEETDVRVELLESVDEKSTSWIQDCLEAFTGGHVTTAGTYERHLAKVLLSLAGHGDCVIVGRGASFLLPAETTLRVWLVAPLRARIDQVGQETQQSATAAKRAVEKLDKEQAQFIKQYFHHDPRDTDVHDLVINTARFDDQQSAELIVAAARLRQQSARGSQAT